MYTVLSTPKDKRARARHAGAACMIFVFVMLLSALPAFAAAQSPAPARQDHADRLAAGGGYTGPGLNASTVSEALSMRDDSYVMLRGHIVRSLGGENYLFQDETGTINVEIDHNIWQGQQIGSEDLVEIQGEVDRDLFSLEIEADRIVKR